MKLKFLWPVLAVSLINPACADTSMTQKALKPLIEYQCGQELKDSKVWKMGTYFMAEANKQHLQQKDDQTQKQTKAVRTLSHKLLPSCYFS